MDLDIFNGTNLSQMVIGNKRLFQEILPELVKRLILSTCSETMQIRIPEKDDIWAPGFDGVVNNTHAERFVCAGTSVWEFGTNSNSLNKVNKDFQKRTSDSLGVEKTSTEFYLVIPYIWAYDNQGWSIKNWEIEHKDEWKKVHLYDASILADWINSEPAVCAWLLSRVGQDDELDFTTITTAWTRFSSKTEPSLSHSLFTNGRDDSKVELMKQWDEPIIKVKADTTYDAYGFCLSTILECQDKAEAVIVIHNQATYKKLATFCNGKHFLLNYKQDCDFIPGNHVISCYSKEATAIKDCIDLPQLSKTIFDSALRDMALPDHLVNNLYRQTHGNLLSLIRKLPGTSPASSPKWANQDEIELLVPLLLLGSFDTSNECDRQLVSFLSGNPYETLFEKYTAWLRLEDAPVKQVDTHYVLVDFEETWEVLRLNANSPYFDRLVTAIDRICSLNDLSSQDDLVFADSQSKRHLRSLLINVIYFADSDDTGAVKKAVDKLINTHHFSDDLFEHFTLLAEAAPTTVMDFLQKELMKENGFVDCCFAADNYSHRHWRILSALDELVLHDETRVRACDCLFALCLKTRAMQCSLSDPPRNSLMNALCLFNDCTLFSIAEKGKLILKYLSKDVEYTTDLVTSLLLKPSFYFVVRDYAKTPPKMEIPIKDLLETTNTIASILFTNYIKAHSIKGLTRLLEGYHHFYLKTLFDACDLFDCNEYDYADLIPLNYRLRELAHYAEINEKAKAYVPCLQKWIDATTPTDSIGRVGWLFYCFSSIFLYDNSEECDYSSRANAIEETRVKIIDQLSQEQPLNELAKLVHCSKDDPLMGAFFARHLSSDLLLAFAKEALCINKIHFLYGLVNEVPQNDCIAILNTLPHDIQLTVLSCLDRRDVIVWLDTSDKEQSYWSHQTMKAFNENEYKKLLSYNPCGLLPFYAFHCEKPISMSIERIKEIFAAILSPSFAIPANNNLYLLEEIISKLDQEGYYSDDWARLCLKYYKKGWQDEYPIVLRQYFFIHPAILCERILTLGSNDYFQFGYYYKLPDNAYSDFSAFSFFVETLMEKQKKDNLSLFVLGGILGRSPDGADGIFPHEFVRFILEKYSNTDLWKEVYIGKINSRGARTVGDGSGEMAYAEKLDNSAKKLEIEYPETAKVLRALRDSYRNDGKRDRIVSEIGIESL